MFGDFYSFHILQKKLHMRHDNKEAWTEVNNWDIWRVDFNEKKIWGAIVKLDYVRALRFTKSENLVLEFTFPGSRPRLKYAPKMYWQSSDSPVWFPTNNHSKGYIIRRRIESVNTQQQLSLIAFIKSLSDQ